jgi:ferredoxin
VRASADVSFHRILRSGSRLLVALEIGSALPLSGLFFIAGNSLPVSVTILPAAWTFAAPDDMPLLLAAQQAGIVLPSSCRNGTCRTCLCHMRSGEVQYRIAWPGVSAEEKRDGYILPCIAYPLTDVVLHAPAARRVPDAV